MMKGEIDLHISNPAGIKADFDLITNSFSFLKSVLHLEILKTTNRLWMSAFD